MQNIQNIYQLILEINNLKLVFRNTTTNPDRKESLEAKIAKAADAICPIFLRLQSRQSYIPFNITIANLEKTKYPSFMFSKTFLALYEKLKMDLLKEKLISP